MATTILTAKKNATGGFHTQGGDAGSAASVTTYNAAAAAYVAKAITVAADVATLVADGATPTQAHVNTLNTDYGVLATDYTALAAAYTAFGSLIAQGAQTADIVLSINLANVTTVSQLRAAFNDLLQRALGSGNFTP